MLKSRRNSYNFHRPLKQSNWQFLFRADLWNQLKHASRHVHVFPLFPHVGAPSVPFISSSCRTGSPFLPSPFGCHTCRPFPVPNSHGCFVATMWFDSAPWYWRYIPYIRTSLCSGCIRKQDLWPNHSFHGCFASLILHTCSEKQCYLALIVCFSRGLNIS